MNSARATCAESRFVRQGASGFRSQMIGERRKRSAQSSEWQGQETVKRRRGCGLVGGVGTFEVMSASCCCRWRGVTLVTGLQQSKYTNISSYLGTCYAGAPWTAMMRIGRSVGAGSVSSLDWPPRIRRERTAGHYFGWWTGRTRERRSRVLGDCREESTPQAASEAVLYEQVNLVGRKPSERARIFASSYLRVFVFVFLRPSSLA